MDWDWLVALVLGLLGGGTVGAIAGAALTVSHERSERFRDRQFDAASRFVADYQATLAVTVELWGAAVNVVAAKEQAVDAAGPAHQALKEAVGIEDVLGVLIKAINVGVDLIGRDVSSEHAAEEIARSRAVIEEAIDNLSGRMEEPFASTQRELLHSLREVGEALVQFGEPIEECSARLHHMRVGVAQLNLLFAGKDAEVVEAARQVVEGLVALVSRILNSTMENLKDPEREDESDRISDEMQDVNELLGHFAALANDRIRPQPLVRELVGEGRVPFTRGE